MANAASSKVKPRTLNFWAAAAKRDEEAKNQKRNEKKGVHSKKKREEKTENDCFSFIKMSFYYGKSSWPIAEVRCQRRWGVKLSKAAATTTAAVKRAANLCAISTGNG